MSHRSRIVKSASLRLAGLVLAEGLILMLATLGCGMGYYRELSKENHPSLYGESFRYEYEVTGMRALPDRALRMIVELRYDAMPVLHLERVRFELDGRVLADADPYFIWVTYPESQREALDLGRSTESLFPAVVNASAEWAEIEALDGDSLRALFDVYEAPGDAELADFDDLPVTESTPLSLRLLDVRHL